MSAKVAVSFPEQKVGFFGGQYGLFCPSKSVEENEWFSERLPPYISGKKISSLSFWRISVGDTPAKWLFYPEGRFLRLSAVRGICARSSAETKKGGF